MSTKTTGGCACGALRYEFSGEPLAVFNCHCQTCKKTSGGAFVSGVILPEAAFTWLTAGRPTYYASPGDSGKPIRRGFCATCGTHVHTTLDAKPGVVAVGVGSLDDPSCVKPQLNFYTDHALSWVHIGDDTKNFPTSIPG